VESTLRLIRITALIIGKNPLAFESTNQPLREFKPMANSGISRATNRFLAVQQACRRTPRVYKQARPDGQHYQPAEVFASNTLSAFQLKEILTEQEFATLIEPVPEQRNLGRELADKVARYAKDWALAKGATHYCHWFQPLTGQTAEKHDSFLDFDENGYAIQAFSGKALMQQEPDASSFPSGGRRSTFEARGYTAWDSSSPMFLVESENGATLCIPSVFVSYSGETLDMKTPLLRSIDAINRAAKKALHLLGETQVKFVVANCGPEQEYFVVDRALFYLRPDLINTGRALVGQGLTRGQQLEDHYFGSIKSRVLNFMMELEHELFKLGVPCKTRHNEVAPSQFEIAPIYEIANIAADHNQLVMETMRRVGFKHELAVLFHEKPYLELNGSGKHVNWSLADSLGRNLLDPGDRPHENIRFLYFLTAVVKAVKDWGGLLRCSVASASNDFRLGANEAPPAIMSVFLGTTLSETLEKIADGKGFESNLAKEINLDLARIPVIARDNTDRNRTSPVAFTGNKFEFRAVGSSQSVSLPAAYLNAIVAQALTQMNAELEATSKSQEDVLGIIKKHYKESRGVCFEGNNYSAEWHKEAVERGLKNLRSAPEAYAELKDSATQKMLLEQGVFGSQAEIELRYNVQIERYIKQRLIELNTMRELLNNHIIPAGTSQLADWLQILSATKMNGLKTRSQTLEQSLESLYTIDQKIASMLDRSLTVDHEEFADELKTKGMELLREAYDASGRIEQLVDDQYWSLPKNSELIHLL
jgi:glutamine synthetase